MTIDILDFVNEHNEASGRNVMAVKYSDALALRNAFCKPMKLKFVFLTAMALALFATGCCTTSLMVTYHKRNVDYFNPSAVYQATNANFVLEGVYSNEPVHASDVTERFHGYIAIPQEVLSAQNFEATSNLSLDQIGDFQSQLTRPLKTEKTLSPDHQKVADLPENDIGLQVNARYPNRAIILLIPFSIAADIVTFPIQLPVFIILNPKGFGSSP